MRRCWDCGREVGAGKPVKTDPLLAGARYVKRKLGMSKKGTVVVCKDCEKQHAFHVKEFKSAMLQFGLLGLGVFAAYGWLSNWLAGLFWGLFVFALSVFKYAPRVVE